MKFAFRLLSRGTAIRLIAPKHLALPNKVGMELEFGKQRSKYGDGPPGRHALIQSSEVGIHKTSPQFIIDIRGRPDLKVES
jgi:hypothetical protein